MTQQPSRVAKARTFLFLTIVASLAALVFATTASAEFPYMNSGPSWSGTPQEGSTLQGHNGLWLYTDGLKCEPGDCTYTYTWQRCNPDTSGCTDIPGATGFTYLLVAADVGRRLRFVEWVTKTDCNAIGEDCRTITKNGVSSLTPVIAGRAVATPTSTALPTVTGTPMEDEVLTGHGGDWTGPEPITTAFQWQRCDAGLTTCNAIVGATAAAYRLTPTDIGFRIRVSETAGNAGGQTVAFSAPTLAVVELRPTPQRQVIPVTKVTGSHRLIIDRITPARLGPGVFSVQIRIRDDRGFRIAGALVETTVIPEEAVIPLRETRSGRNGWAIFSFKVTKKFRPGTFWFFVTARKPRESLQAGASTSTLFKLKIAAPPAAKSK